MFTKMKSSLTYANVIATLALFLALGGGAYAAIKLPKNSVGSKQIKNNAVTSSKVKNGSLVKGDFKAGQLGAAALWAKVATGPSGAITSHTGTGTVTNSGTGEYTASFSKSVRACSTLVTVSWPVGGWAVQTVIANVTDGSTDKDVNLTFSTPDGTLKTPQGFSVAVIC